VLDAGTAAFYREVLAALDEQNVPHLVGGAYAFEYYTGIARHTKDLDVFLRKRDLGRAFETLRAIGCRTQDTFPHWLGKAERGDDLVDLIHSSGNGLSPVDDAWFEHAVEGNVVGQPSLLCPAEEMIWSKAFLMERERYDGADVAHLIRARARSLSWPRLLERFGPNWRVLLAHLVLFGFVYPSERDRVPADVMHDLLNRLQCEVLEPAGRERVCRGTLVSRAQYLVDVGSWGFGDARLKPEGRMSAEDVAEWTRAIEGEGHGCT
jgi:hypothetical protein